MTALNHSLTGAIIGLAVRQPLVALPIAFLSHFVCDALPHYGSAKPVETVIRSPQFRRYLALEALVCFVLVVCLFVFYPYHWWLGAICAFLAASPDLFWINRYIRTRRYKAWRPSWFAAFAGRIQWFQRPIGGFVEAAWFLAALAVLWPFLR